MVTFHNISQFILKRANGRTENLQVLENTTYHRQQDYFIASLSKNKKIQKSYKYFSLVKVERSRMRYSCECYIVN